MIKKLLIANRGEIALRIIRTAKAMGIATVAVYSDVDAQSLAVLEATEAVHLSGDKASDTYLVGKNIIAAAKQVGADAIHPGYGFLSENASFAKLCEDAGITFVGPGSQAIAAMGSKSAAKLLMLEASVPVVPGYQGASQTLETFKREAKNIGYPVLLKAALGGGGKGMRVVEDEAGLELALEQVKREAIASFHDEEILLEKYLARPRHIELQIFCDQHGNGVHLFERDCSIQRRHQKIIEEAPAIGLSKALREQMGQAALAAAKAIAYAGAGTIEFLLDQDENFYFMEMNTRLQVEHPVTEAITGLDLVEWQLRIASGERLPKQQEELAIHGHAIEVRLYAEDPANNFLPQTGAIQRLEWPEHVTAGNNQALTQGLPVRIDTGVRTGDSITIFYDPMIAKVIVWGKDRKQAINNLQQALSAVWLVGLTTNLHFLQQLLAMEPYRQGDLTTSFLQQYPVTVEPEQVVPVTVLGLVYLAKRALHRQQQQALQVQRGLQYSPWHKLDAWRLLGLHTERSSWFHGEAPQELLVMKHGDNFTFAANDGTASFTNVIAVPLDGVINADVDGVAITAKFCQHGHHWHLKSAGMDWCLREAKYEHADDGQHGEKNSLQAPMPGSVVAIKCAVGDIVAKGAPLMIIEAMKMEHTITAPYDGVVISIHFAEGALVQEGDELLALEEE